MNKRTKGKEYEDLAVSFLVDNGFKILNRNFFTKYGEIDIVALEGDTLVFTEVKYRKDNKKGDPAEAVTFSKQKCIAMAANYYLMKNPVYSEKDMRFDVVTILNDRIKIFRNAFDYML